MKKYFLLSLFFVMTFQVSGKEMTPTEQAAESAAREVGRTIGRKIGQDALNQMATEDRMAILERARAATRGEILRRYNYEESPFYNSLHGYVSVLREGKNSYGSLCLEYEIDLVYRVNRYYLRPLVCATTSGEWQETSSSEVHFPDRSFPLPGEGDGGWLPPIR